MNRKNKNMMSPFNLNILIAILLLVSACNNSEDQTRQHKKQGWTLLSQNKDKALSAIGEANEYDINHLQLSHKIVHKLKHLRRDENRHLTNLLIDSAHKSGIEEVVLWDHALYWLGYYPDKFKTGPDSTLNLDNPELWEWIQNDYREMLDMAPKADGVVLTFIETGAHVEDQYSEEYTTDEEKLALLVNKLSEVMVKERDLKLYIRTFIYFPSELKALLACLNQIKDRNITVMTKEAPHDFFLTHPKTFWVKDLNYPVIMEFDGTHEFSGQSVVASIFPQKQLERWKHYQTLDNVEGYVARTDRYKESSVINRPSEINLYALHRATENPDITIEQIYDEFISKTYGKKAIPYVKPAFKNAYDIITSVYYTLGLPLNTHSSLNFEDVWTYSGLVSGRWMNKPVTKVEHGVNQSFHYWKDLVNHLAPPKVKKDSGYLGREILWPRREKGWLDTTDHMNASYLSHIIKEKNYGVDLARKSVNLIRQAQPYMSDESEYQKLYHTFKRTELSARLFRGAAKSYFGSRVYRNVTSVEEKKQVLSIIESGKAEIDSIAKKIKTYPVKGPKASYNWAEDADIALEYKNRAVSR